MTAKEYCIANLGKEISFRDRGLFDGAPVSAMVVGYNCLGAVMDNACLLVSFTNDTGWPASKEEVELQCNDRLLLDSPLNKSYWHVALSEILE